ncbi:RimJ/RimL family protein N-acetyltransferase [Pedobacter sp. CG_S7]|uniref:GNAT family N-acetyltransferase n=1 Tax=Pedobacter sp. CG_S7 TaxID=3143930 RepID=UPI00339840C8
MFKPFYFESKDLCVHPFRSEDMNRLDQLSQDIFSLLSDNKTLQFIPEKRLNDEKEAESFLRSTIINYHANRNYVHFITSKHTGKVIGIIDLISPHVAKEHYKMDDYPYFIEFYLSGYASGCYIMTEILPLIVEYILEQGIRKIGAVINRKNIAARKVLEKSDFVYKTQFDPIQDLYETI